MIFYSYFLISIPNLLAALEQIAKAFFCPLKLTKIVSNTIDVPIVNILDVYLIYSLLSAVDQLALLANAL